jgi:hypothetical protein
MAFHRLFSLLRPLEPLLRRLLPRPLRALARSALDYQEFMIDVIGSCSLRCPSCPVGNATEPNPKGVMPVETYRAVLDKITREYTPLCICLFNWTEPLLHPQLAEIIRLTRAASIPVHLSSNLNVMPRMEEVLRAEPTSLRISLSGFSQAVYCQTHAGGQIEKVKANMRALAELKARTGSKTEVFVYYHKYRHNLHELEPMKAFAALLGFGWMECWAIYMPVEGALAYWKNVIRPEQRAFIENYLALPLKRALDATAPVRSEACKMQLHDVVINHEGQVQLCCCVFSAKDHAIGSFLEMTPAAIRAAKGVHPACGPCMQAGLHVYYQYYKHPLLAPLYEKIVAEELARPREERGAA